MSLTPNRIAVIGHGSGRKPAASLEPRRVRSNPFEDASVEGSG